MTATDPIAAADARPRAWARGAAGMLALGATVGSLLDGIHTFSGVTAYAHPVVLRTAWWVPLLFAGAYAIGLLRPLLDRGPSPSGRTVSIAFGLFALAYALSVLPLAWPLVAAVLTGIFFVSFVACDRTPLGLAIALLASVGGPLFEAALVRTEVFVHTRPALLGVSGWLPQLYLSAAIALQATAKWLVDGRR